MPVLKGSRQTLFAFTRGSGILGAARRFWLVIIVGAVVLTLVIVLPVAFHHKSSDKSGTEPATAAAGDFSTSSNDTTMTKSCAKTPNFTLRIMPLGASITKGEPADSSDIHRNSYRKFLRDKLRSDGFQVNMVGSVHNYGDMADNDNEGHPGWTINNLYGRSKVTVPIYKPNIILVNLGTNDAVLSSDSMPFQKAPERMASFLNDIWSAVPDTFIVLSTLLPNQKQNDKIKVINDGYRKLAANLTAAGRPLLMVDMDNGKTVVMEDIFDGTHPMPTGYKKMADAWYVAIKEGMCRGMIKEPRKDVQYPDGKADPQCVPKAGMSKADDLSGTSITLIPKDAGNSHIAGDGALQPKFEKGDITLKTNKVATSSTVVFASLYSNSKTDSGKRQDDIIVLKGSPATMNVMAHIGAGNFGEAAQITQLPFQCGQNDVRFGDINADGLDDMLCIRPDGSVQAAVNTGGDHLSFKSIGQWHAKTTNSANVRLADVDGDGRLDYCLLDTGVGGFQCWRNQGFGDKPQFFEDLASGVNNIFGQKVDNIGDIKLVDINGDHRADWVSLTSSGKLSITTNQRSDKKGLIPQWNPATDIPTITTLASSDGMTVHYPRVFGTAMSDLVTVNFSQCDGTSCELELLGLRNEGSGGASLVGDGVRFADMRKRKIDDYVWISPMGVVTLVRNQNTAGNVTMLGPKMFPSAENILNTKKDRITLHLADWDGDGLTDVLSVDESSGIVHVWYNKFSGNSFDWMEEDITIKELKCPGGSRFADIDGDGRADAICMSLDGTSTASLNKQAGLFPIGHIISSLSRNRVSFHLVDANGDGKADLYWLDKRTGDAKLWINSGFAGAGTNGRRRDLAKTIAWQEPVNAWLGSTKGGNELFGNLRGDGRATLVATDPTLGSASLYFTICPGSADDKETDSDNS